MKDPNQELQTATENERKALEAHEEKRRAVQVAKVARADLIASAASGRPVAPDAIIAAEEAKRRAEADEEIAQSIHAGAMTLRHTAQIAVWHQQAAELGQQLQEAVQRFLETGSAVDEAFAALTRAIQRRSDLLGAFNDALRAADRFNEDHTARAIYNPLLAGVGKTEGPFVSHRFQHATKAISAMVHPKHDSPTFRRHIDSVAALDASMVRR